MTAPSSSRVRHVVLIGNHPPRRCGIASFTSDLADALAPARVLLVAMNDGQPYDYPKRVAFGIEQQDLDAYVRATGRIEALKPDMVCVQHEYGIFGGPAGSYLLTLLRGLKAPIVTTLHTVLERPSPEQWAVLEELALLSRRLVVMSGRAVELLTNLGIPAHKIVVIPHGVHAIHADHEAEKARLGLADRALILTFGLLGRGKGLEQAIRALPEVVRAHPEVTYLILGATHPHVLRHEGERYREELCDLARELGVDGHLRMDNRFVSPEELGRYLAAADIYLTPYPNPAQITSGTLAYAVGGGKVVVSTPYWHAEELLSEGRGVLVPFHDPAPLGRALVDLLDHPEERRQMAERAAAYGRQMLWPAVGRRYLAVFEEARVEAARQERPARAPRLPAPALRLDHLAALTDGTGLFQHATGAIPNPHEGYTTDDNARALMLLVEGPESELSSRLARSYLQFLHFALDPARGVFRNFLSYDRRWLEETGAENAQARAVRALAVAASSSDPAVAASARELLARARPAALGLTAPRAQAIALLAASELLRCPALTAQHGELLAASDAYAANLTALHAEHARPGWDWFEPYLSYANAELCHGLIAYGAARGRPDWTRLGLRTLAWLDKEQRAPDGRFWPVGCERVYGRGEARPLWDGQPIEASVTVSAASAAQAADPSGPWRGVAARALAWLLGANPLRTPLYDPLSGGCHDGLHRDHASLNQGAESTVLFWQAVLDARRAQEHPLPESLSAD